MSMSMEDRKMKTRIELAPDQPLTTQGKLRSRVYVACLQCRTRKIRCDGAKPSCHNCTRRVKQADSCVYDAEPKRRGPDKTPGARQRMARDARQQTDADTGTTSRHRRKREDSLSPQPQFLPLPAPAPLLVLDPQLADIPPFHTTSASSLPLPHTTLGPLIPDPLCTTYQ